MKNRIYSQNRCIEIFMKKTEVEKLSFVHEFRKLYRLDEVIGETTFSTLLDALESFFPAYRIDRILDKEGNVSEKFYKLEELVLDKEVSDEEMLKVLMRTEE